MADISSIKLPSGNTYDVKDILGRQSIPYGIVTSDSTTVFTATVDGVTQLSNGVCCLIRNNNKQTSASGWTLNVNDLGAKPVYNNMADATRDTTIFNKVYTMLFVYDEDRVDGGCWICYRGYNSNDNTIGYQIRHNSSTLVVTQKTYRYRLLFSGVSLNTLVPANTSTSTSSTDAKTVNSTPINPFGPIYYYGYTSAVSANASPSAVYLWQQYAMNLGYSFTNATALDLTSKLPVFLKCAPQNDGSAIIDSTEPIVQALPSSADGKIYILLGIAYSATNLELCIEHPVFYYDGTAIRLWTGASGSSSVAWNDITGKPAFATVATSGSYNDLSNKPTIPADLWEQGVDGNDDPVQGAIRPKGFTEGGIDYTNTASGLGAFAVGVHNTASGQGSAAFGNVSEASGVCSFAQGGGHLSASGHYSHAEGYGNNIASGDASHVEGRQNTASGAYAHAEGKESVASGKYAHAEGLGTIAETQASHSSGRYNTHDPTYTAPDAYGTYAEIVGNGADDQNRSNARTLDWSGNEVLAGKLTVPEVQAENLITSPAIQTGTGANNYFQSRKFRGEGDANTYYHAIDFGYANHDQVDFYEYGGVWNFHKHTAAAVGSGDTLVGKISSNGWEGSAKLTGTPTAPTASAGTNTTQIATTAFVKTAIDNAGLWEQGVDANDQPVAGAIKAKDFVDSEDVIKTNSAMSLGAFVAGGGNTATGSYAVIAGCDNTANGSSTVFGYNNTAAGGGGSTLLGNSNQATSGTWGFAAGVGNTISHNNVTALGWYNTASNYNAVAMGRDNIASGNSSSAIGYGNTASETAAHAEGRNTTASGKAAHSEGYVTEASGCQSHAEGQGTQATARYNHVFGTYNISDPGFTAATEKGTYIEIVGNGVDAQNPSNARTLDWSGNEWVAGLVSVGSSSTPPTPTANNHLTTKKYVDDIVGNIETLLASI